MTSPCLSPATSAALAAQGRQVIVASALRAIQGVDVGPLAACFLQPAAWALDTAGR